LVLCLEQSQASDVCGEVKRLQATTAVGFKDQKLLTVKGYMAISPVLDAESCLISRFTTENFVTCSWSSSTPLSARYQALADAVKACFPHYGLTTVSNPSSQRSASFRSEDERNIIDMDLSQTNGVWEISLTVAVIK
jgi:hypothetical protein